MADLLEEQGASAGHLSSTAGEQLVTLDDVVTPTADPSTAEPTTPQADDLPDKYKGKTAAEIAHMHQEAERLVGRQSAEVGELRRVVDGFIANQTAAPAAEPSSQATVEEVDFFDDPEKAVARAIENHPKVRQAEESAAQMQRISAVTELQAKHPDLPDVLADPTFMEWVQESPFRQRLFVQADKQYSAEAADELVSTWKERKQLAASTLQVEETSRKQQQQAASTGVTTGSGESSKKIYRRVDIIKLMQTDPQRYQQLQPEIMQAYAEKRVR
jgi:hypothetical protein